jgi:localization factor PodJL
MPGDHARSPHAETTLPGDEPAQFFDPEAPWDAESAEALTRVGESEEGRLWRHHEGDRIPRTSIPAPPFHHEGPAAVSELEPRLAELFQRMQDTLAAFDPDASLAPLNRRLDALEEKLAEALAGVAQRSDVDGLRLIEAQVSELAAHVEQTRSRLDRLDAMDEQMRGLTQKIDDAGLQRLDELERALQTYVAEWRRSDERHASTLGTLNEAVSRIGETIDAAEALKPATDLSLAGFGHEQADPIRNDPLSQVYADGARALAPKYDQFALDAADYAPGRRAQPPVSMPSPETDPAENLLEPVAASRPARAAPEPREVEPIRPPLLVETARLAAHEAPLAPPAAAAQASASAAASDLEPPAFRASAIRARLRQMQLTDPESAATAEAGGPAQAPPPQVAAAAAAKTRSVRPSLLLAAGLTLFAAAGYLLVDVFLTPHEGMPETKRLEHGVAPEDVGRTGSIDLRFGDRAPNGRMVAMGAALAAVLKEAPDSPSTALYKSDAPPADDALPALITPPALTIGPASLRQAAMSGDPAAQYEIGQRYAAGRGVNRDLTEALRWYMRAASRGLAPAQFRVAGMHERGLGVEVDTEKARSWYLRAAQQGHVKAMHNLAVLSVGGGRSDYATAAKWFTEAAGYGLADSQFNLAILHQNGLGIAKDLKLAYQWLSLAARGGDREAGSRLEHLRSLVSLDDIRSTDAAVAAWRPRTPNPAANESTSAAVEDR